MPLLSVVMSILLMHEPEAGTKIVSFATRGGGLVYADEYGTGQHGIVLAHGARFNKGSWAQQAAVLEAAGFHVLAIDFRGYGQSRAAADSRPGFDDMYLDVLGAVEYLHAAGARTVSLVGASMGGKAVAEAAVDAKPGTIDGVVLLAGVPIEHPEKMGGRKLFVTSRGDSLADKVRDQFQRAPEPKQLLLLEGSAHAQAIFATDQGEHLMHEMTQFLSRN